MPGVTELEIEELSVGLRPGTPDNLPAIGPGALDGLWWATGHYRNGILLAPLTAELVLLRRCSARNGASCSTGATRRASRSPASADRDGRQPRGGAAVIVLNGERTRAAGAGATLAAALARLDVAAGRARRRRGGRRRGGPARRAGATLELAEGARVEVLTAMQGG